MNSNTELIQRYKKQLSDLDQKILEAQRIVDEQCQNKGQNQTVSDVLNTFKKWIQFFYLRVTIEADEATSKLAVDLKMMYGTDMKKLFDVLYKDLVCKACEVNDEDLSIDEGDYSQTLFHKQSKKFIAGVINPGGFVSNWKPIVESLCKWLVSRYHGDESRKKFLDDYLIHIKTCLDRCVELSCADLPGMNQILKKYTLEQFESMKIMFLAHDERIYEVYSGKNHQKVLCPFQIMTATAFNPKGQAPKTCEIAAGNLDDEEVFEVFIKVF